MPRRAIPPETRERVLQLVDEGWSYPAIAEETGVSQSSVQNWAHANGKRRENSKLTDETRAEAIRLVEGGLSRIETARRLGISDTTVGRVMAIHRGSVGTKTCPVCSSRFYPQRDNHTTCSPRCAGAFKRRASNGEVPEKGQKRRLCAVCQQRYVDEKLGGFTCSEGCLLEHRRQRRMAVRGGVEVGLPSMITPASGNGFKAETPSHQTLQPRQRACVRCGSPFEAAATRAKYCGDACREEARSEKKRAERKDEKPRPRSCDGCGEVYEPRSPSQRFCGRSCSGRAASVQYNRNGGRPLTNEEILERHSPLLEAALRAYMQDVTYVEEMIAAGQRAVERHPEEYAMVDELELLAAS